eukprot:4978655-Prymnesium_polylepis.1
MVFELLGYQSGSFSQKWCTYWEPDWSSSPTVVVLAHALELNPSVTRAASAAFFSRDRTRPDDTWRAAVRSYPHHTTQYWRFYQNTPGGLQLPFARQPLRFWLSSSLSPSSQRTHYLREVTLAVRRSLA